jgi:primosomal replication protein N
MLSIELESALGGLYSLLSTELQMPLVNRLLVVMKKKKSLPELPKNVVSPVIITGVEALGRGNDLQKLDLFLAGAAQVVGAEAVAQFVNVSEYFKRRATSLGIKTQELIKSPEQMQQEAQQAQQAAMMQAAVPNGVNAISNQISQAQDGANMEQQQSE